MTKATTDKKPDGRVLRSERSRQAIIDAMLDLVQQGNLVPTAQQVAEHAGVGIRTVFRHFKDMEGLFKTMDAATIDVFRDLFSGGDRDGSLNDRIQHAVEIHADAYEQTGPIMLATKALMWRFEILRNNYARGQKELRRDLQHWLPEMRKLPALERELVEATASFEYWNRLREQQGLSKKKAMAAVAMQLSRHFNAE